MAKYKKPKVFFSTFISILFCLSLFTGLLVFSPNVQATDDWPMYRYDTARTGYVYSEGPLEGELIWSYMPLLGVDSFPSVYEGRVYFSSSDSDSLHYVTCVNASTGALIWQYPTSAVAASPAIIDGKVYVSTIGTTFYCLNASTGSLNWSAPVLYSAASLPVVVDGRVYVGSLFGTVYCLDANNGSEIWTYPVPQFILASVSVSAGRLYIGALDNLTYCLNCTDGSKIWDFDTGSPIIFPVIATPERAYVISSLNNYTYCLNVSDGIPIWNFTVNSVTGEMSLFEDKLYFGANNSYFYCFNATTGIQLWNNTIGRDVLSTPALVNDKIYLGSQDNYTLCLNASNADLIWEYKTTGAVGVPAVAYGKVYINQLDGPIICLGHKPPQITNIGRNPYYPDNTTSVTVSATITDASPLSYIILNYTTGSVWLDIAMTNTGGNNYEAVIPQQPLGTIVYYYIEAQDDIGNLQATATYNYTVVEKPATGWLGWAYRKPHTIQPSLGAGTNYQIKITVNYGSGVDSGENVYCENLCRPDFGDIRFSDNDGVTPLDYWLEEKINGVNATFWIEIADNLSTAPVLIYMYYGNPNVTDNSNGDNTFIFFDDFQNGVVDPQKWILTGVTGGSTVIVENGVLKVHESGDNVYTNVHSVMWPDVSGVSINYLWKKSGNSHSWADYIYGGAGNSSNVTIYWNAMRYDTNRLRWLDQSTYREYTPQTISFNPGIWYKISWDLIDTSATMRINDSSPYQGGYKYSSDTARYFYPLYFGPLETNRDTYLDNVFVRKLVGSEPAHGDWGSRENHADSVWSFGWQARKSHIIESAPGAGTDYQVKIIVHYGIGTDSQENVYCNGHCRGDFGDIRFTDDDGVTLLDYWIEEKTDGDVATFWVEVRDNLSSGDAVIYIYYGNPYVTTTSNGHETFLFFDDFEDGNLDEWNLVGTNPTNTLTIVDESGNKVLQQHESGDSILTYAEADLGFVDFNISIHCNFKKTGNWVYAAAYYWMQCFSSDIYSDTMVYETHVYYSDNSIRWRSVSVYDNFYTPPAIIINNNQWYTVEFQFKPNNPTMILEGVSYLGGYYNESYVNKIRAFYYNNRETNRYGYLDNFFVRKFVTPEPIHGTWGSAELGSPPTLTLTHPLNIIYYFSSANPIITWVVDSGFYSSGNYQLYMNGTQIDTGTWIDETDLSLTVTGLNQLGIANITLCVEDDYGTNITDQVDVEVIIGPPSIVGPSDFQFVLTQSDPDVTWQVFSLYYSTGDYDLYLNGSLIDNGTWTNSSDLTITIMGLNQIGMANLTLWVQDGYGNNATDQVNISVVPPQLSLTDFHDFNYLIGDPDPLISWVVTSNRYLNGNYTIYLDGLELVQSQWDNNTPVEITLTGLNQIKTYLLIMAAEDQYGNLPFDLVYINAMPPPPQVTHPPDFTYLIGEPHPQISWTAYSNTSDHGAYDIYLGGFFLTSGTWNNATPFTIALTSLNQPGNYTLRIRIHDAYDNIVVDFVEIQVVSPPLDLFLPLTIGLTVTIVAAAAVALYLIRLRRPT